MYAFYKSTPMDTTNGHYDTYIVGMLFLDTEIEKGKALTNDSLGNAKELLLEKIPPLYKGFSDDMKVIVVMDFNFFVHKVWFDKVYIKQLVEKDDVSVLQKLVVQAINSTTKQIVKAMQRNIGTNEISLKDFIDRIALNHDKRKLWFEWIDTDEYGNRIEFYAPHGVSQVSSLEKLERYNG